MGGIVSRSKPRLGASASAAPAAAAKPTEAHDAAAAKPSAPSEEPDWVLTLPVEEVVRRASVPTRQALVSRDRKGAFSTSLTAEGEVAAAVAAAAAAADKAAADAASAEERVAGPRWVKYGGKAVEELLTHTPLVTAQYLIALAKAGGIIPRGQEVPAEAKVTLDNAWRLQHNGMYRIPVLVLSYAWADPFHPDRGGGLLRQVLPVLETMLQQAQDERTTGHGVAGKGNKYQTVGVFIDYAPRTPAEEKSFHLSLQEMWRWYAHPLTTVLLCTTDLPGQPEPTNPKTYGQRGWCFCERRMASLAKGNNTLWDLRNYKPGMSFEDLWQEMRKGGVRKPFLSPDSLDKEMRSLLLDGSLVFSYTSDMEVVSKLYRSAFEEAFRDVTKLVPACDGLFFKDYGWDDQDLLVLLDAFDYMRAHKCCPRVPLRLQGNKFSPESVEQLKAQAELHIDI